MKRYENLLIGYEEEITQRKQKEKYKCSKYIFNIIINSQLNTENY